VVDGFLADEVDRADDVVEVARLQHRGGAVLGAGDEVALDAELQRRRADELAVGVEVVLPVLLPERVAPELEGLTEAVDVLGDAQLLDAGRRGGGQVALDVLGGEVALGCGPLLVGTEVQVVVGQHGPRLRQGRSRGRGDRAPRLSPGMGRQLLLLLLAFAGGVAIAELLGAINLGTAFGVGQLTFVAVLVWILLRD
jgi:hypothetical protein